MMPGVAEPCHCFIAVTCPVPPPTPSTSACLPEGQREQAAQVLRQFRVVFNAVRTHFQQVEKRVGIGGAQVWALHVVREQSGIGVNDLARRMDIHQSTASNLVRQLVKRGLVRPQKSTIDRRNVQLFVEPAGLALLQGAPGPYEGVLPEALQKLSPATLMQLQHHLAQLVHMLQADESAAGIPLASL